MLPEVAVSELAAGAVRSWLSPVAACAAASAAAVRVAASSTMPSTAAALAGTAAVAGPWATLAASFGLFFVLIAGSSLDIAGAYPPQAGITEWRRTVRPDGPMAARFSSPKRGG